MSEPTDQEPAAPPCSNCQGAGGAVVDTSSDGVIRQTWQPCDCGGSPMPRGHL